MQIVYKRNYKTFCELYSIGVNKSKIIIQTYSYQHAKVDNFATTMIQ